MIALAEKLQVTLTVYNLIILCKVDTLPFLCFHLKTSDNCVVFVKTVFTKKIKLRKQRRIFKKQLKESFLRYIIFRMLY